MCEGVTNTVEVKSRNPGRLRPPSKGPVQTGCRKSAFLSKPQIGKGVMSVVFSGAQVTANRSNRVAINRTVSYHPTFAARYPDGTVLEIEIPIRVLKRIDREMQYL